MACVERCISIEKRPEADLRADLKEWLALSRPIATTTTTTSSTGGSSDDSSIHSIQMKKSSFRSLFTRNSRSVVPNLQNRRLALMALHSVRNLRKSSFSTVYKALFTTTGISKDSDEV